MANLIKKLAKKAGKGVADLAKANAERSANKAHTKNANAESLANIEKLAMSRAKKRYTEQTGKVMTPAIRRANNGALRPDKAVTDYIKNKDAHNKALRKKYDL